MDAKILVLATCYNRCEQTKECLESLIKGNPSIEFDFIIVNDGSNDGTKLMLETFERMTAIEGNGNLFYSGGMRRAISKAKSEYLDAYDYVMFINDDVKFFVNSIEKLVKYENKSNKIIVGAVCDSNGEFSYGGEKLLARHKPKFISVKIDDSDLMCDTTCANCVLIPRNIFESIPNIDDIYSHAMGDFDYFFEAIRKGYKIKSSNFYVGQCNDNDIKNGWRDTSLTRRERLRKKESAKGLPFKEWFHYLKKNHGLLSAIYYSATAYIRILLKR